MTEVVKDFYYYADKAEACISISTEEETSDFGSEMCVRVAAVYAELAKAAPKVEKVGPSQFFYFVNGKRVEGERCLAQFKKRVSPGVFKYSSCVKTVGHDADGEMHETEDGVHFDE